MTKIKHTLREQRRPHVTDKVRKQRSDKKVDIRVPVTDSDREFILWSSRSRRESMTKFCTEVVQNYIANGFDFKEHPYVKTDFEVHVKADETLYKKIVDYSVKWNCSIREATHRILTDSLFYMQGGTHIESFQRS